MSAVDNKKRQQENLAQLDQESAGREKRIRNRRARQRKLDAERRRKRLFKAVGSWVGIIFVGFFALTWFSQDFVSWLHGVIN